MVAGKRIHGISTTPGGVQKKVSVRERDYFLNGKDIPSVDTMITWSKEILDFIKEFHLKNKDWVDDFAAYPSGHLGLVDTTQ